MPPVCTCLRLRYARVDAGGARVGARLREYHALSGLAGRMCCNRAVSGADTTNDLTGLGGLLGAGLCAGLGAGFWGPCWPVLGPCWGFAIAWAGANGLAMPVFTVYPHSAGWAYSM